MHCQHWSYLVHPCRSCTTWECKQTVEAGCVPGVQREVLVKGWNTL